MQPDNLNLKSACVIKIKSPFLYSLKDSKSQQVVNIQLQPSTSTKTLALTVKQNTDKTSFFHLLKRMLNSKIQYDIIKKNTHQFKDDFRKGNIFLDGQNILNLYEQNKQINVLVEGLQKMVEEILQCYVVKVQGLKLTLYIIQTGIFVSFYFSQLKLPKPPQMYAKTLWQKSQQYFQEVLQGQFVQIKVNGHEKYREQVNIYGQILRRQNGQDMKQKIVADGYAQISKNGEKYLAQPTVQRFKQLAEKAVNNKIGLWQQHKKNKATSQGLEIKYKIWETWVKQKKTLKQINNGQEQIKFIIQQFKKQVNNKIDPNRGRQIIQVFMSLTDGQITNKSFSQLEEFTKNGINAFVSLSATFHNHADNTDLLKFYNKLLSLLIFYMVEQERLCMNSQNKRIPLNLQFDKAIKLIYKTCYTGNETFDQKIFGKKKQCDFESFSFDAPYLDGGFSSYSECSDYQDESRSRDQYSKIQKKLSSMYSKIRFNSTQLISMIFKSYPSIVENHWQLCVKPNILNHDFFAYLQKMSIQSKQVKMSQNEKKEIVNLMRTNFGENSLILLLIFETNAKIKMNVVNCLINMIINFQGKKMIDTTEKVYIEKLLKQTKSSYVPKSFIIFSGLRNILYFMLFSLHYEKNILIVTQVFKALSQLCYHSTIMDKMGFVQGMGLLMENYITPVLDFPWQLVELRELKIACVSFLGVLVSTQNKWNQIQAQYLLIEGEKNINYKLLNLLEINKQTKNKWEDEKAVIEITKYFMKLAKRYYDSIFFVVWKQHSIWSYLNEIYMNTPSLNFIKFVEEVFKCYSDQMKTLEESQETYSRRNEPDPAIIKLSQDKFKNCIQKFISVYSKIDNIQYYSSLLNTISYIEFTKWSEKQYQLPKKFLLHCFNSIDAKSIQSSSSQFISLDILKNNPLVRLSLIKIVGYMSFCPQFQKQPYISKSVKILLKFSQKQKSPNSIIKITWGLSNWAKLSNFSDGLSKQQLLQCLEYLILHSKSQKQKIASNSTRGIGFFIKNVTKQFDFKRCIESIINNLSHTIIKVRTNSTKTLRIMVKDLDEKQIRDLVPTLQTNLLKNNFHLQTQTLHLVNELGAPIPKQKLLSRFNQILNDLNSHTTMQYQFSEIKAIKQLRRTILAQIIKIPQQLKKDKLISKDILVSICNYLEECKEESIRRNTTQPKNQIFKREFEKGEEVQNLVFNLAKNRQFDEEKTITTEATINAMKFEATEKDIQLIEGIKSLGKNLSDVGKGWDKLAAISIQDKQVVMEGIDYE